MKLHHHLRVVATGFLTLAAINPFVVRLMSWESAVAAMPLLVREVFMAHTYFIGLTCAIFGTITWRFARDIAAAVHPMMRWWAGAIGIFWLVRVVMQWTFYSASHWVGKGPETTVHWVLTFCYAYAAITFLIAALRK